MKHQTNLLLPVKETLRTAWGKVSGSKRTFCAALAAYIIIDLALTSLKLILQRFHPHWLPVVNFIGEIVDYLLQSGLMYIGIRRALNSLITYTQVFVGFKASLALKLLGMLLFYIVYTLIIFIPISLAYISIHYFYVSTAIAIALVIVYFYLFVRVSLATAFILDKEIYPWTAIKLSFQCSHANFWRLSVITLIEILILTISIIPLGIVLVWTLPIVFNAIPQHIITLTLTYILIAIPLSIGLIWTIPFILIVYGEIYKYLSANIHQSIKKHS